MTLPRWIDADSITDSLDWWTDLLRGGCASHYMPAVTYYQARATMHEHGDDVCEYLADWGCSPPALDAGCQSWSGYCCDVLSMAVETYASCRVSELEDEGE